MDDPTFEGLLSALAVTPEDRALLSVVLQAVHRDQRWTQGLALLDRTSAQTLRGNPEVELLAAGVALESGLPARALEWAPGESGEAHVLRARACLALDRKAEGLDWYRKAIAANATLESPALEAALTTNVRTIDRGEGKRPLRVISNDDTSPQDLSRIVDSPSRKVTFADVGGLDAVKEQIRKRIILPFQKPSLFQRFKKRVGGGILLYGPPGCGKTLLARATAGECNASFFAVAISDVLDMYIGESERKLHALFEKARGSAPAVIFFDELEALAARRQSSREAGSAKMVSQFLSEMDGFSQNNTGVLVLGATNVPWAVDSAFRRPGRFDRVQFVPPPDQLARQNILTLLLANRPVAAKVDITTVAKRTSGFSGADLEQIVETAADHAIDRSLSSSSESVITQQDLDAAAGEVKPTALEWLTTARNFARYANESGHYDEVLRWLDENGKA